MNPDTQTVMQQVRALVVEYRQRCLWYLRDDDFPSTPAEAVRVLEAIERHGDLAAFQKVSPLMQWLLLHSSEPSAA